MSVRTISPAGEDATQRAGERPHIVFVVGETEYDTLKSLRAFAEKNLKNRAYRCTFVTPDRKDRNSLPNIDEVKSADLVVLSVRRRTLPNKQLAVLRKYLQGGGPLVAIRTSSHAFALRGGKKPPQGRVVWQDFDREVLGGHYTGHHGRSPDVKIWLADDATGHAILRGIDSTKFRGKHSLYKSSPLAKSATPLLIGSIPGQPPEPVAWTNTYQGGRIFYTSLGAVGDFAQAEFQRLMLNAVEWALDEQEQDNKGVGIEKEPEQGAARSVSFGVTLHSRGAAEVSSLGRKAKERLRKNTSRAPPGAAQTYHVSTASGQGQEPSADNFDVADDLVFEEVLSEPKVRQPVFLNFDERGRMWVVQYLQYPDPAGLKMLSRDKYFRNVYDKVPPAPPHHFRGADKITIHEDTNGDGRFDKQKTFVEGLSIVTSVARGRGGVWVLNPPYLLFYPDKNHDDVPDGDPVVHLAGFGIEDTHSCANSLRWGPDGWLYGAQGSTVSGNIVRPGLDEKPHHSMGQLVWRYHPEPRRYEVFAEGGGNAFGLEFDSAGRLFSGHNGGNTRGFHYVQGGYYRKGFAKHGPLSNPYTFGYFPAMKHPEVKRFSHTFVIYEAAGLPDAYRGRLLGVEPLQSRLVLSEVQPHGSSLQTKDVDRPVKSADVRFRPVDIKVGPDEAIYVADFCEQKISHRDHYQGVINRDTGRIYRLRGRGAEPARPFDLAKLSSAKLIELLGHENKWFRQTALRLLGDRQDETVVPVLRRILDTREDRRALDALWALYQCGGLTKKLSLRLLAHVHADVRAWTVRLACDDGQVTAALAERLAELALSEPEQVVRSQLAASARRLPVEQMLPIVMNLAGRSEDVDDVHIPLLLWWAIEAHAEKGRDEILTELRRPDLWRLTMFDRHITERLMRRYAAAGSRRDLLTCAELFRLAPDGEAKERLLTGFEKAFEGRSLSGLPAELTQALSKAGGGSLALKVRMSDSGAVEEALKIIADPQAKLVRRIELVRIFAEVKSDAAVDVLLQTFAAADDDKLLEALLVALQTYDQDEIAPAINARYPKLSEPVQLVAATALASRAAWTRQILSAVDDGRLPAAAIPLPVVRKLLLHDDRQIARLVRRHWGSVAGASTEELAARVKELATVIRSGPGDPARGKLVYVLKCGKCHRLFDHGGDVGPDLTPYERGDIERLLTNVVNPSREIRKGFETYAAITADGRTITGFLADQDQRVVDIRGIDGQSRILMRDQIEELRLIGRSIMPDGLLKDLTDEQVRNLFAYLRSSQPLNR